MGLVGSKAIPALARFPYHYGPAARWYRLHSSFKFGDSRMAFWIMTRSRSAGFVGRYLYAQIPRSLNAAELSPGRLRTWKPNSMGTRKKDKANRRSRRLQIDWPCFVRAGRANIDRDRSLLDDLARSEAAVPSVTSCACRPRFRTVDHLILWNSATRSSRLEFAIQMRGDRRPCPSASCSFPEPSRFFPSGTLFTVRLVIPLPYWPSCTFWWCWGWGIGRPK